MERIQSVVAKLMNNGKYGLELAGGSDVGHFIFISKIVKQPYFGFLHKNDIILEVDEIIVAGFSMKDMVNLLQSIKKKFLRIKVASPCDFLSCDLRVFLATDYKDNADIREIQERTCESLCNYGTPYTTMDPDCHDPAIKNINFRYVCEQTLFKKDVAGELLFIVKRNSEYYAIPKPKIGACAFFPNSNKGIEYCHKDKFVTELKNRVQKRVVTPPICTKTYDFIEKTLFVKASNGKFGFITKPYITEHPKFKEAMGNSIGEAYEVCEILTGSTAEQSGLKLSDVIFKINNRFIYCREEYERLLRMAANNGSVIITILRNCIKVKKTRLSVSCDSSSSSSCDDIKATSFNKMQPVQIYMKSCDEKFGLTLYEKRENQNIISVNIASYDPEKVNFIGGTPMEGDRLISICDRNVSNLPVHEIYTLLKMAPLGKIKMIVLREHSETVRRDAARLTFRKKLEHFIANRDLASEIEFCRNSQSRKSIKSDSQSIKSACQDGTSVEIRPTPVAQHVRLIVLNKLLKKGSYGFTIQRRKSKMPELTDIVKGSPADAQAELIGGEELLEVNDVCVKMLSLNAIKKIMKQKKNYVRVKIASPTIYKNVYKSRSKHSIDYCSRETNKT